MKYAAPAIAFGAFLILGVLVSASPPDAFDRAGEALLGRGVPLASFLTAAGLFPVYAGLCGILLAGGFVRRDWLGRVALAIVTLVVAWRGSDLFKDLFRRPRPEHWLGRHETSFSYASGHATLALAFYGLWAIYLWDAPLPPGARRFAVGVLAVWIVGIGWSRLALGAHYPTDVLGGYLLGAALLLAASAVTTGRRPVPTEVGATVSSEVLVTSVRGA